MGDKKGSGIVPLHTVIRSDLKSLADYFIQFDLEYWHNQPEAIENLSSEGVCDECNYPAYSFMLRVGICKVFDAETRQKVEPTSEQFLLIAQEFPLNTLVVCWCLEHEPEEYKSEFWQVFSTVYNKRLIVNVLESTYAVSLEWVKIYLPVVFRKAKCKCGELAWYRYSLELKRVVNQDNKTELDLNSDIAMLIKINLARSPDFSPTCHQHSLKK